MSCRLILGRVTLKLSVVACFVMHPLCSSLPSSFTHYYLRLLCHEPLRL